MNHREVAHGPGGPVGILPENCGLALFFWQVTRRPARPVGLVPVIHGDFYTLTMIPAQSDALESIKVSL